MEGLLVTIEMYRDAFLKGGRLALRNWPVLGSVFAYAAIMTAAMPIIGMLGLLGGFLLAVVYAACVGSFLYLVEMMIRTSKVTLDDFKRSFGVYLRDVIAVNFVLWIAWRIVGLAVANSPQGAVIIACLQILVLVLFNAVPELIYLGHHGAVELLGESYQFIADNWIEWFPPNILLGAAFYGIWQLPVANIPGLILRIALASLFLYFAMVVRGLLFIELSATSRRGRIFRRRSAM